MKILNDEQLNYLKSLDSKKKRRKFMLDCLVESVIGESVKFTIPANTLKEGDVISFTANATTAPRTFEKENQFNWYKGEFKKVDEKTQDELLKFDMLKDKPLEEIIKDKLCDRGFSPSQILNNRGLIGATIEETISKTNESANSEKKYTEEDIQHAFACSRVYKKTKEGIDFSYKNFEQYFKQHRK